MIKAAYDSTDDPSRKWDTMLDLKGEDPCAGCNMNRSLCHGRPRRQ